MRMDEEKKRRMIDKAINKLGISEDLVYDCHYPVSRLDYGNGYVCEFKERGVCIVLKRSVFLMVFGLEDEEKVGDNLELKTLVEAQRAEINTLKKLISKLKGETNGVHET